MASPIDRADTLRDQLQQRIQKLANRWVKTFRVQREVEFVWLRGQDIEQATCECDIEYDTVTLSFNLDRLLSEMRDDDELDRLVCHEVSHVTTWPLWQLCDDLIAELRELGIDDREARRWERQLRRAGEYSTTLVERAVYNARG